MNNFWRFRNVSNDEGELILSGPISSAKPWWADEDEGIYEKQFTEDLKALGSIKNLTVKLNSVGGDVFAASAIYTKLKSHAANVTVIVEGIAASAATVIMAAADTVKAPTNALIMIHNPLTLLVGYYNKDDLAKKTAVLDTVKESILNAYMAKTGRDRAELSQMMDRETWMTAEEAKDEGFVDEIMFEETIEASFTNDNRFVVVNSIAHDLSRYQTRPMLPKVKNKKFRNSYEPQPVAEPNGNTVEYTLDLTRCRHEIKPGVVVGDAVCYNGTVPGPTIRATEGDTVRITLRNQLDGPTSIHWHGLRIPVTMDGVPPFSQTEVEPGGEFVYEFVAPKAGTYMYHPHGAMHMEQIDKGAYGFVVVDPADGREVKYDREYTLMLSSWTVEGAEGMEDMGYNTYTINGKTYPAVVLDVAEGEHVRLRFGNLSAALAHPIHIHGHDFRLIAKDGSPLPAPWVVNTVNIAPGETYDLDFVADNPGIWVGHCHNLHHLPDMTLLIRYDGFDLPEIDTGMDDMEMSKDKKKKKKMDMPMDLAKPKEDIELEIKTIDDLRNKLPDLYNQAVANAATAERERLKAIDDISATIAPELVNKAKYEQPMSAEALAFESLKADAGKGRQFDDNRGGELETASTVAASIPQNPQDQNAVAIDKIAAAMNQKRGR